MTRATLALAAILALASPSFALDRSRPDVLVAADIANNAFFPSIVRLADGRLLVAYYDSPSHISQQGRIALVESTDDGRTWTPPRVIVDGPTDDRDPSLMQTSSGAILLSYFVKDWDAGGPFQAVVSRSEDGGRTWSAPAIVESSLDWSATSAPIVELPDKDLLIPIYGTRSSPEQISVVIRSEDGGQTWPRETEAVVAHDPNVDFEEPAIIHLGENRLFALLRTARTDSTSYEALSNDGGRTWETPTYADVKAHAPDLLALDHPSGRDAILQTWGDYSGRYAGGRPSVARVVFADEAREAGPIVLLNDANCGDESYPSAAQLDPSRVFVVYYDACAGYIGGIYLHLDAPTVSSVYPRAGRAEGGTRVTLRGHGFERGTEVTVGGQPAREIDAIDRETLVFISPPGAAGSAHVVVRNFAGMSVTVEEGFEYRTVPEAQADTDADGMPDEWELDHDLDPTDPGDARTDADADGAANADEFRDAGHPRGSFRRHLTGGGNPASPTTVAVLNPGSARAAVQLSFLYDAGRETLDLRLPAHARREVRIADIANIGDRPFQMTMESNVPVVAERRVMTATGALTGLPAAEARRDWYFAGGAPQHAATPQLWIGNPTDVAVDVDVTYLRSAPAEPLQQRYSVPYGAPFPLPLDDAAVDEADESIVLRASHPVVAERRLADSVAGAAGAAASEGTPAAAPQWLIAEAGGPAFETMLRIANPTAEPAAVEITSLQKEVVATSSHVVPPQSHIVVAMKDAGGAAVQGRSWISVLSTAGVPIVVERLTRWGDSAAPHFHVSPGAAVDGPRWALADVPTGGPDNLETWLSIANVSSTPSVVRLTLMFGRGPTAERLFNIAGHEVLSIPVRDLAPEVVNRSIGVLVEAGAVGRFVVGRSTYRTGADGSLLNGTAVRGTLLGEER